MYDRPHEKEQMLIIAANDAQVSALLSLALRKVVVVTHLEQKLEIVTKSIVDFIRTWGAYNMDDAPLLEESSSSWDGSVKF